MEGHFTTNLREMGIPDDEIQRILRHADIGTRQQHYAKTLPVGVRKAMSKLDGRLMRDKRGTVKGMSAELLILVAPA